ncbi:MAG: thymidine phosphorylase [Mycoplasmoidaceae bacterium]
MTNINNILNKKIQKQTLTKDEIYAFVNMATKKEIKDYQIAAMLSAIFFNGMSFNETYWLTIAMRDSGYIFNSSIDRVDKHSTGGVGDKVTLIIAPILAAFDVPIFKISGRGLGFTGGTIDKLDSIGVRTAYALKDAEKIFKKNKMAVIQQTADIVPADKIFYAIRNDTAMVQSIPLIVSSIMSKKLALGANHIYLDIKIGDGALFKDLEIAKAFSDLCVKIGKKEKVKVKCYFTNMNEPLGRAMGNKIEIVEATNFLRGKFDSKNLKELILTFASDILIDFKKSKSDEQSKKLILEKINSGMAFKKFVEWTHSQECLISQDEFENLAIAPRYKEVIIAKKSGHFKITSTLSLGEAVFDLGGGRIDKDQAIDYDAGILLLLDNGTKIKKNQPLMEVYSDTPITKEIIKKINKSFEISSKTIKKKKIILGEVK